MFDHAVFELVWTLVFKTFSIKGVSIFQSDYLIQEHTRSLPFWEPYFANVRIIVKCNLISSNIKNNYFLANVVFDNTFF